MDTQIANIVFVKKILADGSPCRKCEQIIQRLHDDNLFESIDQVIIARDTNPESEGMRLAQKFKVDRAPFFIVEYSNGEFEVFDIYLKFRKKVASSASIAEENTDDMIDLIEQFPELDYI